METSNKRQTLKTESGNKQLRWRVQKKTSRLTSHLTIITTILTTILDRVMFRETS